MWRNGIENRRLPALMARGRLAAVPAIARVCGKRAVNARPIGALAALCLSWLALGCVEAPAANAPVRSPALDYRGQPPTTSDGRVVGADEKPIEDRLDEQTHTGWGVDAEGKPTYDKRKQVGGHVDQNGDQPPRTTPAK